MRDRGEIKIVSKMGGNAISLCKNLRNV